MSGTARVAAGAEGAIGARQAHRAVAGGLARGAAGPCYSVSVRNVQGVAKSCKQHSLHGGVHGAGSLGHAALLRQLTAVPGSHEGVSEREHVCCACRAGARVDPAVLGPGRGVHDAHEPQARHPAAAERPPLHCHAPSLSGAGPPRAAFVPSAQPSAARPQLPRCPCRSVPSGPECRATFPRNGAIFIARQVVWVGAQHRLWAVPLGCWRQLGCLSRWVGVRVSQLPAALTASGVSTQGLAARYGHPVHALNLVKAAEKRPRESILRSEFSAAVSYLNSTVRALVLCPSISSQARRSAELQVCA